MNNSSLNVIKKLDVLLNEATLLHNYLLCVLSQADFAPFSMSFDSFDICKLYPIANTFRMANGHLSPTSPPSARLCVRFRIGTPFGKWQNERCSGSFSFAHTKFILGLCVFIYSWLRKENQGTFLYLLECFVAN